MPYRIVQWATGNVGRNTLAGIDAHPELQLVGLFVSNPDKVGRDAGELAAQLQFKRLVQSRRPGIAQRLRVPRGVTALEKVLAHGRHSVLRGADLQSLNRNA